MPNCPMPEAGRQQQHETELQVRHLRSLPCKALMAAALQTYIEHGDIKAASTAARALFCF